VAHRGGADRGSEEKLRVVGCRVARLRVWVGVIDAKGGGGRLRGMAWGGSGPVEEVLWAGRGGKAAQKRRRPRVVVASGSAGAGLRGDGEGG
jgi:hypothetical protein